MASPSNRRATKRRRSSITELAFHGIHTSRPQKAKSVTHVSGTECHPCLGPLSLSGPLLAVLLAACLCMLRQLRRQSSAFTARSRSQASFVPTLEAWHEFVLIP